MEIIIWVIVALAVGLVRNLAKDGFPRLPDGRDDTPLGPGGQGRGWPPKLPGTERSPAPSSGEPAASGQPIQPVSDGGSNRPETGRLGQLSEGSGQPPGTPDVPGDGLPGPILSTGHKTGDWQEEGSGTEGQGKWEGRSNYGTTGPVAPTLREPHETVRTTLEEPHVSVRETVHVSTVATPASEYVNKKRQPSAGDTERVFFGQSSYDRFGMHPAGRSPVRRSAFSFRKVELARAVILAEILGPPRARNPWAIPGKWRKR